MTGGGDDGGVLGAGEAYISAFDARGDVGGVFIVARDAINSTRCDKLNVLIINCEENAGRLPSRRPHEAWKNAKTKTHGVAVENGVGFSGVVRQMNHLL